MAGGPWLVWSNEHGAWWAPDGHGYTSVIDAAGRYSQADADEICRKASVDGQVTMPRRAILGELVAVLPEVAVPAPPAEDDDDQDRPTPLTAEDGKRIMAEVTAHPRRDVIEQLAESMYDLANDHEDGPGGGMWHWLGYAHAVVEGVPDLYVAANVPPVEDGEPTSDDTRLAPWDLRQPPPGHLDGPGAGRTPGPTPQEG